MKPLHLFIHIPKTGGTSFKKSVIQHNIEDEYIYKYKGLKKFILNSMSEYEFVDGHFPYGIHLFTRKPTIYYTILREPIDHAISYYYFIRQCNYFDYKHPKLNEAKKLNLVDFTKKNRNIQCRTLAGLPWGRILPKNSRWLLKLAKTHLFEKCINFGVLDSIEHFEDKIANNFNWNQEHVYEKSKITKIRPTATELNPSERVALKKCLALDISLYNEAKKSIIARGEAKTSSNDEETESIN